MGKLLRLYVAVGAVAAVLSVVGSARPGWATTMGVDWWSLPSLENELQENFRLQNELDQRTERVLARLAGRQRVIGEVVGERMNLLEAAVEFRRLNQTLADSGPTFDEFNPGNSEGERLCRHVIGWTESCLCERTPSLAKSVVKRLEAELRRLVREGKGVVRLPEE